MTLPARLQDARRLLETIDFRQLESAVANESKAQLVIIGPVNSGKSSLFNQLKGKDLSAVSAVPGTTRAVIHEQFGPFLLVDTPGFGEVAAADRDADALDALRKASIAVLVLDASAGLRQSDFDLHRRARSTCQTVIVALNKVDLIERDLEQVLTHAEDKLGVPLIPISAHKGTGIADGLIPAIIDAQPGMAVTIGRALPRFRAIAARRIISESARIASVAGAEPIPGLDFPIMVAVQVRMLLRLAAIYGHQLGVARARELLSAIAGGAVIRYAAQELVKLIPGPGWLVAGATAWTGTTALGRAAIAFFESDQKLTSKELRKLYNRFRSRRSKADMGQDGENGAY